MNEHEKFLEMCANYTLGSLSELEIEELDNHLEGCSACREAMQEFQEIVSMGLPAMAPDFAVIPESLPKKLRIDRGPQRVFARIQNDAVMEVLRGHSRAWSQGGPQAESTRGFMTSGRRRLAVGVVALVLVMSSLIAYRKYNEVAVTPAVPGYRLAAEHNPDSDEKVMTASIETIGQLTSERNRLNEELQQRDHSIALLTRLSTTQSAELAALKDQLQTSAEGFTKSQTQFNVEKADRIALEQEVVELRSTLGAVQQRLDSTLRERASYLANANSLERKLENISRELKEKNKSLEEQTDLLSHDRDIRDIIGARELYVAEVNDVGRDAKIEKPFGRVFFTKGKSLIFYAYDLDRQQGLRRASTFQAWGRRGPDFSTALPLGIMYLDNTAKRRWVLRLDDPEALAKIDGVFVTIEPSGGSEKPTGKPLLFAYLKIEPNHP